ncbi:leucyl/phenylalanyl-tRNA--protein transferase [Persicitalea jodogahamensis]|uniref:Leucyl/phenylalanyl-tRNA--protein transferase n=1 Tax=Persicitalea jodogahamensis TaxID=402147 RepID=A0A8J3D3B3_9BACT|nr:leucyl/phenylalanyl-tRNA--protein transferase [Persicitalea jodogahamensis]GHB66875.1 leucyl/phenylalanyl-tRNA--protein transferase [Persicitalea jodogahamensis]
MNQLTADDLIYGYINGIFPMADADGTLYWYSPDPRAIIPIDSYRPAKSLRPTLNKRKFEIRINCDFEGVMRQCAAPRTQEDGTWISEDIIKAYTDLHDLGMAHSVEAYQKGQLVGGLYGVSIGAAFFGESMFHTVSNASKVAFHALIEVLRERNFRLLDTQFMNDNVRRFGAVEIPKLEYIGRLRQAISLKTRFTEQALEPVFQRVA